MSVALAFFGLLLTGAEAEPTVWCTYPREIVETTNWGIVVVRWEPECFKRPMS